MGWMGCRAGLLGLIVMTACGEGPQKADERGVGEGCLRTSDCRNEGDVSSPDAAGPLELLECLLEFKGGYCGLRGCTAHQECPEGSLCVVADNGGNYCFLVCREKADCNAHRPPEAEANCSSSLKAVDDAREVKVCVPPSAP